MEWKVHSQEGAYHIFLWPIRLTKNSNLRIHSVWDMIKEMVHLWLFVVFISVLGGFMCCSAEHLINLPDPTKKGKMSLEESIFLRRSVREFSDEPVNLDELSQLLWASQGKVKSGRRAAPSAGALYPLEIYAVCGNVEGLAKGVYLYDWKKHSLSKILDGDKRWDLSKAALGQYWVRNAPLSLVLTAIYERTTSKYGERGIRYVHIEVGHVAQNVLLQAVSLNLGAVPVGAFYDEEVKKVLGISKEEHPLYIVSIGRER